MGSVADIGSILRTFVDEYKKTPPKVKVLDAFIVYALATAAVQFVYMVLVGTFPFNSFLAGILCSLSFFSLTVCLRMQIDPSNKDFTGISPERAFADFLLANAILFLAVFNYIG